MPHARIASSLLGVLLLTALAPGCGDTDVDTATLPGRLEVVQRRFEWTATRPAGTATPIDASWSFARGKGPWSTMDGTARLEDGMLVMEAPNEVMLAGPWSDFLVDVELQHRLRLELASQGADELILYWRRMGEMFDRERSFTWPLTDGDELQSLSFRLSTLKSALNAPDAAEGFAELMMRFRSREAGTPVSVRLATLALESDFELPEGREFLERPLERRGLRLPGLCWPLPGSVSTVFEPGTGERVRLALAVAGRGREATVIVRDAEGRLPPVETKVLSNSAWRWVEVDLAPVAGQRTTLVIEAASREGSEPGGVVLVGGLVRLAPERVRDPLPPPSPGASPPTERPDVLLYLVDTLRADRLGAYGYDPPTDPVLSRIASEGVRFGDVTALSNWTRPSTSSLLTGTGPEVHGNLRPGDVIDATLPTLAEAFAAEGYLTVSFVTNHHAGAWSGLDRGFDVQYEPRYFPRVVPDTSLTSHLVEGPLADFLTEHAGERLFVYVHTLDPHGPYEPPAEDLAAVQVGNPTRPPLPEGTDFQREQAADRTLSYDAEIRHNDRRLGSALDTLASLGMDQRTLVAFTSDHGEGFLEHGSWTHWRTLFQEELGVPLVMHWPEGLPAGRVVEVPVSQADLAPTLASLAGIAPPSAWTGFDLSALCRPSGAEATRGAGSAQATSSRPGDLASRVIVSDAVMEGRVNLPSGRLLSARRGPAKLIVAVGESGALEPVGMFDLGADPLERVDLLASQSVDAGLLAAIREYLLVDEARSAAAGSEAVEQTVDAERLQWLREMGYLK